MREEEKLIRNPNKPTFCPFINDTCDHECSLYACNDECAIMNLGSVDLSQHIKALTESINRLADIIKGK